MSRLVNELRELGDILTHLDMEHARDAAGAYNRRLAGLFEDALIIARLYWREQSEGGGSLLKPITFTKGESHDDVSDPQQFVVPAGDADGILSWSFKNEEVVWAEHLDCSVAADVGNTPYYAIVTNRRCPIDTGNSCCKGLIRRDTRPGHGTVAPGLSSTGSEPLPHWYWCLHSDRHWSLA